MALTSMATQPAHVATLEPTVVSCSHACPVRLRRPDENLMSARLTSAARRLIPPRALEAATTASHQCRPASRRFWSQGGEDAVLQDRFASTKSGFFVDVGAFDPRIGSNTYAFYRRGWSGVNIDAKPGSMRPFRLLRRRDTNIEAAIGDVEEARTLFVFAESELNTLDEGIAQRRSVNHRLLRQVPLRVQTLASLLKELGAPSNFEFLTIDCEGLDEQVLRGNDWTCFQPEVVVIEGYGTLDERLAAPGTEFLRSVGFRPFAATSLSLLFERDGR